jgi:CO/xanthine dehydrogenase Mo-binding subunit
MVVGGLLIKAARRLRETVEARNGDRSFGSVYREDAALHGPTRIDQPFEPYPGVQFDDETYRGDAYPAFGWAACVASVDVDLDSGEVTVRDVVAADDVGRVIHPVLAEGQVEGGTLQAIGYATVEEIKLRDGRYLNDRLATYIIPTSLDAPRITSILVEAPFSLAPHGAKGVGELPMDVGAPAVVAAIHDAIGVWVHDLPATPERILAALGATGSPEGPAGFGAATRPDAAGAIEGPIAGGTDPRPDARTDPQPLRGPGPDDRRVDDGWHDA